MFEWDTDEIVFADGRDFDRVGEFEYGCVGMGVGGYDLFGGFGALKKEGLVGWLVG